MTPATLKPRNAPFFEDEDEDEVDPSRQFTGWWSYRRVIYPGHLASSRRIDEATILNWPHNDYMVASVIDRAGEEVRRHFDAARQLSLSLLYWLQTERPRPDGGCGYPGLYPRPDVSGAAGGLAKAPYIRESRRIRALRTVTEAHVGTVMRGGWDPAWPPEDPGQRRAQPQAETFEDSVGIGYYRIDLHPSTGGDNYIDISCLPFQIPLGALLPRRVENLLPACKTSAPPTSPTAAIGCIPWSGTSARRWGCLPGSVCGGPSSPDRCPSARISCRIFSGCCGIKGFSSSGCR